MNYLGIDKSSISNGTGVRVVLWVSGCTVHCKGCQNPESWDFCAGKLFDDDAKQELFDALSKPYIRGITFSGGNPLELKHLPHIYGIIVDVKKRYPSKDIWFYTGYELSIDDFALPSKRLNIEPRIGKYIPMILQCCDIVVDGPYIEEQRDITLKFRGSSNQRIIDVKETLKQSKIITIQN
jgi:anaerobic ribonucleoside-triphosphate reductase activating protein